METRGAIYLWSFMLSGVHGAEHTSGGDAPPSLIHYSMDDGWRIWLWATQEQGVWVTDPSGSFLDV
jgi:hypothetical protein